MSNCEKCAKERELRAFVESERQRLAFVVLRLENLLRQQTPWGEPRRRLDAELRAIREGKTFKWFTMLDWRIAGRALIVLILLGLLGWVSNCAISCEAGHADRERRGLELCRRVAPRTVEARVVDSSDGCDMPNTEGDHYQVRCITRRGPGWASPSFYVTHEELMNPPAEPWPADEMRGAEAGLK